MSAFESIILGIVQGITEFLPISSSAHLVLVPYFFNWTYAGLAYDVALHMGTLAAILMFFWKDWIEIIKDVFKPSRQNGGVTWKLLVVATIPGAVAGVLLDDLAETHLRNPLIMAGTLTAFGALLWYWDRRGKKSREVDHTTIVDALIVGTAQAIALVPGVSRSGVTITAALMLGLSRQSAVRFSFLLSAPIIAGAGLMKAKDIGETMMAGGAQATVLASGFIASLISGFAALGFLSYIARSKTFTGFVFYRWALALVIIAVVVFR